MTIRHKVFVSYYHSNDENYREKFEKLFRDDVYISKSVEMDDIDEDLATDRIRQIIRDKYLRDSTVTVVLIGSETWKRKYVDWEIGSSIRDTRYNPRSGLLGILLPTHSSYRKNHYDPRDNSPKGLHDNVECNFAQIHNWSCNALEVSKWIHQAFLDRNKITPDNSFSSFKKNRSGEKMATINIQSLFEHLNSTYFRI